MASKRRGRVVIKPSRDKQVHFVIKAANGEVVAQGETYKKLGGAKKGVEALQRALKGARVVIKRKKK